MNKLIILIIEFFKIGLFAIGGGLATIPFLKEFGLNYQYFNLDILIKMIAISESTPGPVGVNMATYVGTIVAGYLGGIIATLSLVLPSIIIICLISKFLKNAKDNQKINNIFYLLRPMVIALISAILIPIFILAFSNGTAPNLINIIIGIYLFILFKKTNCHPIFTILIAALLGIFFKI